MSDLIENLLYQSEGTALDFKKEQYFFQKATDEQKSELLKDILAFANSWRQDEAYIVIGVEEVVGGRQNPIGTEDHFDDSRLQQFINGKTNRQVNLAYEVHLFEGKKIGIIRIPKQERPIYAVKNYGKVQKEVVYYRSGSSTAIANPDDIARMGKDSVPQILAPIMDLKFVDLKNRNVLGTDIKIPSLSYGQPKNALPDYRIQKPHSYFDSLSIVKQVHAGYWRDKEEYIRMINLLKPIGFMIQNQSNTLASNVRVEIINNFEHTVKVLAELPSQPHSDWHRNSIRSITSINRPKSPITISHHGDQWTLEINFGNIQPKSIAWLSEPFFLGSMEKEKFDMKALIYADNIPEPQQIHLTVNFTIENKPALTFDDLRNMPPFND
jgi:Putative DNA-binding domain